MPKKLLIVETICPKCKNMFIGHTKFCSRKCSNSRVWNDDINSRRGKSVKETVSKKPKTLYVKKIKTTDCISCGVVVQYNNSRPKYCLSCRKKRIGGYRPGSGRSKSGYYKGIYCGSTYELIWVIYNLDHNISFHRFEKKLTDDWVTYFPDFSLDDGTIIELKVVTQYLINVKLQSN